MSAPEAGLTHVRADGSAHMVDVSAKAVTHRQASAAGRVLVSTAVVAALREGTVPKGVALAVVGGLFLAAALHANAAEARGLDGALRTLAGTPYGPYLLTLVALGIGAYGVYSFFRARYTTF